MSRARSPAIVVVAAALFVAGCDRGFALGVTVERSCLPVDAALIVDVVAHPGGQTQHRQIAADPRFTRFVVLPPGDATSLSVDVRAVDLRGATIAEDKEDAPVDAPGAKEIVIALGSCGDGGAGPEAGGDASIPVDAARPDLPGIDLTLLPDLRFPCASDLECMMAPGGTPTSVCCGLACADTANDLTNCGGCGKSCPSGVCLKGACSLRVFASSIAFTGNLGGYSGADAKCQGLADAVHLGGKWMAWVSDANSSPSLRFTQDARPYVNVMGNMVVASYAALVTTGPQVPMTVDENGKTAMGSGACMAASTWTATASDGTRDLVEDCNEWTTASNVVSGGAGNHSKFTEPDWTHYCSGTCDEPAALYCFEQ